MKKILMVLIILAYAFTAQAGGYMLDGVYETGASVGVKNNTLANRHTVGVWYTDANTSISALVVELQGSSDPWETTDANSHWFTLAEHTFALGS